MCAASGRARGNATRGACVRSASASFALHTPDVITPPIKSIRETEAMPRSELILLLEAAEVDAT